MKLKCKICGVSNSKILNFIVNHKFPPQFVGFIVNYPKSKRFIETENLKSLINVNKNKTKFVAVLVKPDETILKEIKDLNFDYYQLYDVNLNKTKEIKERYKIKIISAITVSNQEDVDKYKNYSEISDIILFDSKGYHKSENFDHNFLTNVPSSLNKMIAGNIQIEDIPNFKNKDYIIDISGALEDENGNKSIKKIDNFLNAVHNINS